LRPRIALVAFVAAGACASVLGIEPPAGDSVDGGDGANGDGPGGGHDEGGGTDSDHVEAGASDVAGGRDAATDAVNDVLPTSCVCPTGAPCDAIDRCCIDPDIAVEECRPLNFCQGLLAECGPALACCGQYDCVGGRCCVALEGDCRTVMDCCDTVQDTCVLEADGHSRCRLTL
jgi:hypothetical protein